MKLLVAIDTSGKQGGLALAQCVDNGCCNIIESVPLTGGTFSAQLVPQIAAVLTKHGFTKQDIGAFAVASGPGSFTGLRVGLAAIKALAEVLSKPIAEVSLLEALAVAGDCTGRVVAALDAGRKEAYVGEYEIRAATNCLREQLLTMDELAAASHDQIVVTPDQTVAVAARSGARVVKEVERPGTAAIAQIGWRKIQAGETVAPEDLEANYIRRSDAEIFSKPLV